MRESNASARGAIEGGDSVSSGEIAELFDRWETKIEMLEVHTSSPPEDPIEDEFEREEEEARLKDILASLRE
jgi:phage shock protein A